VSTLTETAARLSATPLVHPVLPALTPAPLAPAPELITLLSEATLPELPRELMDLIAAALPTLPTPVSTPTVTAAALLAVTHTVLPVLLAPMVLIPEPTTLLSEATLPELPRELMDLTAAV